MQNETKTLPEVYMAPDLFLKGYRCIGQVYQDQFCALDSISYLEFTQSIYFENYHARVPVRQNRSIKLITD